MQSMSQLVCARIVGSAAPLDASYTVSGSKLAAISVLAACALFDRPVVLTNVPHLLDTELFVDFFARSGGEVTVNWESGTIELDLSDLKPTSLVSGTTVEAVHGTMHLIPALLARFGTVSVEGDFGGCEIGERPISHILKVARSFGAEVTVGASALSLSAQTLTGTQVVPFQIRPLDKYHSGATKAAIMLGVGAHGRTIISQPYHRVSVIALCDFLASAGAAIDSDFPSTVTVEGGTILGPIHYRLPGDELEAVTALALLAMRGGRLQVNAFQPLHCAPELSLLRRFGVEVRAEGSAVTATRYGAMVSQSFSTSVVDTDCQPLLSTVAAVANGSARVLEHVWENRFSHVPGLAAMGADVSISGNELTIRGPSQLQGADVTAADLRAAAALINAAANADGVSVIRGLQHLKRGYEDLLGKYRALGIDIATT